MTKTIKQALLAACAAASLSVPAVADNNPIIQTIYTADPAPMVHEGTLYLYTGHDEDNAPDNKYLMHDYQCFSTTDMVNWTHLGNVLDIRKVFKWSGGDANAAQVIFRNGKFYYYVSTGNTGHDKGGIALGVAVSDKPTGPFVDAIGKPLVTNDQTKTATHGWDDLDPTVFIDDDGKAYLYWGNNACYYAELNEDMISLKGPITGIAQNNKDAFGPDFEEAPWFYKRNGIYYLVYASQFPEFTRYSTSKSPTGPWTYKGTVMAKPLDKGLGTNHTGIVDFKGNSYLFYHTASLPKGGDKRRSVCVAQFSYNADGTIPEVPYSKDGITKGVAKLNPFTRVEAETIAWESGIKTAQDDKIGVYVTDTHDGSYIRVRDVDFTDKGAAKFTASVAAANDGGALEIHFDTLEGPLAGLLKVKSTGGAEKWETQTCTLSSAKGVHDVYLKFTGSGALMNVDWWKCEP